MYGGEIVNEVYTKLGATEYAAEIAQIRASDADSVFFFLPGGKVMRTILGAELTGVGITPNPAY